MALTELVGNSQNYTPGLHGGLGGYLGNGQHPGFNILQPSPPSVSPIGGGGGLGSVDGQLPRLPEFIHNRIPLPVRPPNFIGIQPQPPMFGGLRPMPQPVMPDYSSQFEKFGEQLTGFGDQMTGYQDALGSFNEQVGGMGKQFETITNRLDSVDKGLGSLGNQIAGLEQAQSQAQPVMQPQRPAFNPFGFGGFGGLGSLFGRRY